jgi:hypothetical protein
MLTQGPSPTRWLNAARSTVTVAVTKCAAVYGSVLKSKPPNRCVLKCIEVYGSYTGRMGFFASYAGSAYTGRMGFFASYAGSVSRLRLDGRRSRVRISPPRLAESPQPCGLSCIYCLSVSSLICQTVTQAHSGCCWQGGTSLRQLFGRRQPATTHPPATPRSPRSRPYFRPPRG